MSSQLSNHNWTVTYNYGSQSAGAGVSQKGLSGLTGGFSNGINTAMGGAKKIPNIDVEPVNIKTAQSILNRVIHTNIVPFLWGPPGIGKSSIVRQLAEDLGWEFEDFRLAQISPVDIRGLPVADIKEKLAHWLAPAFLPKKGTKTRGILFLDEINLAPQSVQSAAYQLILDKRVGEYEFPDTWRMVAAGNRTADQARVYKLSAPLLNRFIHLDVEPDFVAWKPWAETYLRSDIVDYLKARPEMFFQMPKNDQKAFPTPRSWHHLSDLLDQMSIAPSGEVDMATRQLVLATVGEMAGKDFLANLRKLKLKEMTKKVEDYIKGKDIDIPKSEDERQGLAVAIYRSWVAGDINDKRYEDFVQRLHPEEREKLDSLHKSYGGDVKNKLKRPIPDSKKESTMLIKAVNNGDITLHVDNSGVLEESQPLILFDEKAKRTELVVAKEIKDNKLYSVRRGVLGTQELKWPIGTYIQTYDAESSRHKTN